jgi:uncharacterized protein YndB with AHSA1/START domain
VSENELFFERGYDLPPVIVWDALVDEVLLEGWLAVAEVDGRVGGRLRLVWQGGNAPAPTNGVIREFEPPTRLVIDTDNAGLLDFTLTAVPGGSRGTSTALELRLTVDTLPRQSASTVAYWRSNFDQLEELLRGRPVDWSNWQRDRGPAWAEHLRQSSTGE